ncbi:MAG: universal stress protein [bacterium]
MLRRILVPLDRSPLAEQALGRAIAIAAASHAGLDVVLVHQPLSVEGVNGEPWDRDQFRVEQDYLSGVVAEIESADSIPTTYAVLRGDVVNALCKRVLESDIDLVVMTSHGRTGFSRAWLGSVADGLLRHSSAPLLMLPTERHQAGRATAQPLFKKILVPFDGSELASEILSTVVDVARCGDARLTLLQVVRPVPIMTFDIDLATGFSSGMPFSNSPLITDPEATSQVVADATARLASVADRLRVNDGAVVETHVIVNSRIPQAITDFALQHGVDAIGMSTHGRGASRLLVGSVADKIIRGAGLPVLLRRPVGAEAGGVKCGVSGTQGNALYGLTAPDIAEIERA